MHRAKESDGKTVDYVYAFDARLRLISSEKQV
jgi:hypothetical protein